MTNEPKTIYNANKVEFITSAPSLDKCPTEDRPEVVFLGRSNVGKSSCLNSVLRRNSVARTSKTPGRTRLFNYFNINDEAYFVDMPGYGYAKVSQAQRQEWNKTIYHYLAHRKALVLAVLIIDSRLEPQKNDIEALAMLEKVQLPVLILATKTDKLGKSELNKRLSVLKKSYSSRSVTLLPFSSVTRVGVEEFWWELTSRRIVNTAT
ncbi:ribosome biogenesis GTP-binding protein YihA/YsxC [Chrysiogenes arsenatis]|uniref:ribosome biogenesis GTP-binding protein YihA/YsxC n=1 Tax=Chrysiogenes arsenatis TaxID=309797 RepID=UPI000405FE79|nr:ribosome biogenesis GTP-binding protein YihA/YsxC [Chrysiogenes arsenatis]